MTEIEWKEQSADLKELFENYTPLKGDTITIWDINGMNQIFNMSECEFLINEKAYKSFKASGQYKSDSGIKAFSDSQKVQKYIVIGRLMKDGTIPWSAKNRLKYNWA